MGHGNYGVQHNNEFIANCCLRESNSGEINFIDSIDNTLTLYVHEFSHSIVNPLTPKYNNLQLEFFNDIKEDMQKLNYWHLETIINEHIIRAIEVVFMKLEPKIPNNLQCAENYLIQIKKLVLNI